EPYPPLRAPASFCAVPPWLPLRHGGIFLPWRGFSPGVGGDRVAAQESKGPATMSAIQPVLDRIDAALPDSIERLFSFVRIPSISTDPAYAQECRRAAEWLVADLKTIGFTASVRDTTGHPMVVARHEGPAGSPHVLFYGHYD